MSAIFGSPVRKVATRTNIRKTLPSNIAIQSMEDVKEAVDENAHLNSSRRRALMSTPGQKNKYVGPCRTEEHHKHSKSHKNCAHGARCSFTPKINRHSKILTDKIVNRKTQRDASAVRSLNMEESNDEHLPDESTAIKVIQNATHVSFHELTCVLWSTGTEHPDD